MFFSYLKQPYGELKRYGTPEDEIRLKDKEIFKNIKH